MWRCCLNPKVIGGLAAVGLVVWLLAPASGGVALPLLITLICPLSMGIMAWRMYRGGSCAASKSMATSRQAATPVEVDAELRALREELAIARARRHLATGDDHSRG